MLPGGARCPSQGSRQCSGRSLVCHHDRCRDTGGECPVHIAFPKRCMAQTLWVNSSESLRSPPPIRYWGWRREQAGHRISHNILVRRRRRRMGLHAPQDLWLQWFPCYLWDRSLQLALSLPWDLLHCINKYVEKNHETESGNSYIELTEKVLTRSRPRIQHHGLSHPLA